MVCPANPPAFSAIGCGLRNRRVCQGKSPKSPPASNGISFAHESPMTSTLDRRGMGYVAPTTTLPSAPLVTVEVRVYAKTR